MSDEKVKVGKLEVSRPRLEVNEGGPAKGFVPARGIPVAAEPGEGEVCPGRVCIERLEEGDLALVFTSEEDALRFAVAKHLTPVNRRDLVRLVHLYLQRTGLAYGELLARAREDRDEGRGIPYSALKRLAPFFSLVERVFQDFLRGDVSVSVAVELAKHPREKQEERWEKVRDMRAGEAVSALRKERLMERAMAIQDSLGSLVSLRE